MVWIEDVQEGDAVNGQRVVKVSHGYDVLAEKDHVEIILDDGHVFDGYAGYLMVEIERNCEDERRYKDEHAYSVSR